MSTVRLVAEQFLSGGFPELNGLGVNDAVHVLATRFQLHKADLRSAITQGYDTLILEEEALGDALAEVLLDEEYVPSKNAAPEGGEA